MHSLGEAMEGDHIEEEREDRMCYIYGKWDHMAKNCWERHKERVVEMPQESAKENGGQ